MDALVISNISNRLALSPKRVEKVVHLLENGASIPFIARYRKEVTDSMDEVEIGNVQKELERLNELIRRKESILKSISEQGYLSDELKIKIEQCWNEHLLEDLYLPFKKKVKTKASVAREAGLEGLAKIIMAQNSDDPTKQALRFLNDQIPDVETALEGAIHIIAEWISENTKVRSIIRKAFERYGIIYAQVIKEKEEEGIKFKDYFHFQETLKKIPSHRLLAILRGESEKVLRVKIDIDVDPVAHSIAAIFIKKKSGCSSIISSAIDDALKRLLLPSLRNEFLKLSREKADEEAIKVFARNAEELLLSPPLGNKRIMGIDPGYRTGCKVVCIDATGSLLGNTTIYPHFASQKKGEAETIVEHWIDKYKIEAIAIGNGTAGKETYQWLHNQYKHSDIQLFLVNEDGASIYSASETGREEFPSHDITVRGAVSIARRLMDPLAELVKIDPKSIGVGQYQHDVNQKWLRESLTQTVISCVNKVGINLNTASKHLLSYVSGLGPALAENIVKYREAYGPFSDIRDLKKVPRLGERAFEQCAGFLRIREGKNPLDNTGVHPESYDIVRQILLDLGKSLDEVVGNETILDNIKLENYVTSSAGIPTLKDIISELKKPGLDPRSAAKEVHFTPGLTSIDDLVVGQIVAGVVTNITNFGAFVDLGIKESALLHVSQISDHFVSNPSEVLSMNQQIRVKIMEVDKHRRRISVSRKGLD